MSNTRTAGFQSDLFAEWVELDEADLKAVRGGGVTGALLDTVTNANSGIGNGGRPTSGALLLVGTTAVNAGNYVIQVSNGAESGLQAVNAGAANIGDNV